VLLPRNTVCLSAKIISFAKKAKIAEKCNYNIDSRSELMKQLGTKFTKYKFYFLSVLSSWHKNEKATSVQHNISLLKYLSLERFWRQNKTTKKQLHLQHNNNKKQLHMCCC
jgi:hypothetical protein